MILTIFKFIVSALRLMGLDHLLKKQQSDQELSKLEGSVECLSGQTTDSGGGRVLESLYCELMKTSMPNPLYCAVTLSSFHGLQLCFASGVKQVYVKGVLIIKM